MSIRLCPRPDCPLAEITDDLCDLVGVRCVAYQKARDALTKHFKFVACRPGQFSASDTSTTWQGCTGKDGYGSRKIPVMYLVPLAMRTSAVGVVISPLNGLMDQQVCVR